ncbi:MAG: 4'-phosphopantetheinyl transferase superfamily protein [Thermoanaerobaculaceae bacterium]|nr:4'-phosphopantetheinyl transferase superfamily protein [Thermoanaerobaculaceae bacterium]MDI9620846.1 4'-phosphopantetheinyl transferase superfamily protein [Acidobacteriota bacterium]NLH12561.1 4'-phosphopantetheinyl transferase superfamily protein [Holophagae bacterium]HPW54714.1 4'-phosphopantetheinyl transferase superfamily protein [Thermoanaerobaculaceae bacterium]
MIVGVGVDIVAVERLRRRLGEDRELPTAFMTPSENAARAHSTDPIALAARVFAAKEAIVKLLRVDGADGVLLGDIELHETDGCTVPRLVGRALAAAQGAGADRIRVATSEAEGRALAVAVAERAVMDEEKV